MASKILPGYCGVVLAILAAAGGCLPSTKIHKNPGDRDRGVRFYRPKPYLFVRPMVDASGRPVRGFVTLETMMLPDFSEEYSIHVRSGLGTNATKISLTDGWRLDGLNVELESQTDETIEAMAELAGAVPTLTSGNGSDDAMAVPATNVPLGYYEAVVSRGPDCKKRLYGFRYVGFMPYAACPVESGGIEARGCHPHAIYGLVFAGGTMRFKPLAETIGGPNRTSARKATARDEPELIGGVAGSGGTARPPVLIGQPSAPDESIRLEDR